MNFVLIVILAVSLDRLVGEPEFYHPLVGFGRLATRLENRLNGQSICPFVSRFKGVMALAVLLGLPVSLLSFILPQSGLWADGIAVVVLYLALGGHSLEAHANDVYQALNNNQLVKAQTQLAKIVSRDTNSLDTEQVATATVESVLENGCDAIFAAVFWFGLAGVPGVMIYRLTNTLDAMWGYKTPRYLYFGWAAARLDDGLNYIPARLTALSYACTGQFIRALNCWFKQGGDWKSPNAGVVMATGAGALGIKLGGMAVYQGQPQQRPILGQGRTAKAEDIKQAIKLVNRALILWLVVGLVLWQGGYFARTWW